MIAFEYLALLILNIDSIHGKCNRTGRIPDNIAILCDSIYQIFIHKTKRHHSVITSRCNLPGVARTVIGICRILPYQHFLFLGYLETAFLYLCCNLRIGALRQINSQNRTIQIQIQDTALIYKGQLFYISLENSIRFITRYEYLFFYGIEHTIVLIYQYSHSSLMASAVHISIYHESHISCLIYIQDFDTMMVIYCPDIVLS